jgi:hypothetical protein
MRVPRVRRRWLVLAVVVVLVLVSVRLLYQPLTLDSYRTLDARTLVVTGHGAPGAWTNLSDVTETDTRVTVRVDALTFTPFPGTAAGYPLDVEVRLDAPLGGRTVVDGSTGLEVPVAADQDEVAP